MYRGVEVVCYLGDSSQYLTLFNSKRLTLLDSKIGGKKI